MRLNQHVLSSAAAVAIACVMSAAAYYYKSRNSEVNEVMVFCKLQYNAFNYFDQLLSFINAAKKSVNVCMPGIHNPAIHGILVELLKKKNVKVRIIIDRSGYNDYSEVFIKELIDAGAEFKCKINEPIYKMQHKFCLVDDRILMTGTLNWGNDRSFDHWNYVYITSKRQLIEPVKQEFYQMWNDFSNDLGHAETGTENDVSISDEGTAEVMDMEKLQDELAEQNQTLNSFHEINMTPGILIK